jgi:hypothetical protein
MWLTRSQPISIANLVCPLYDQGARRRLDPTVVVSRLNGEKVAEGVMPFG